MVCVSRWLFYGTQFSELARLFSFIHFCSNLCVLFRMISLSFIADLENNIPVSQFCENLCCLCCWHTFDFCIICSGQNYFCCCKWEKNLLCKCKLSTACQFIEITIDEQITGKTLQREFNFLTTPVKSVSSIFLKVKLRPNVDQLFARIRFN